VPPTTAASAVEGCIAFMNAAFGFRLTAVFFAADFVAADFFAAGFLAALFLAAGVLAAVCFAAGFLAVVLFAAFLAVARCLLPVSCAGGLRCSVLERAIRPRHDAPSAATIPHFPLAGRGARGKFRSGEVDVATMRTIARCAGFPRRFRSAGFGANPAARAVECRVSSPRCPLPPPILRSFASTTSAPP
jgi:hypothetical protein